MMLILSEQVTASSHHILPRPVFPASREAKKTYIDRESYKRKELDESSDFIYVQFSCTSIIPMFRVPFGLSQLSMLHLAQKKNLYTWTGRKKKG